MNRRDFLATTGLVFATDVFGEKNIQDCCKISVGEKNYDTEVLVIGGGPAGTCAAIAAGRMGVKTMIVESGNCLGGMATKGLVGPFMTCYDSTGNQMIIRGLFEEIVDRLVDMGCAIHPSKVRNKSPWSAWITEGHDHVTPFEAEGLKYLFDCMTTEAKVKVLFHTSFVEPIMNGDIIKGAVVLTRSGLIRINARIVIDATGDGDVASRSGVPFDFGNKQTGKVQPSSLFFHISNVDSKKLEADVEKHLPEFRRVNNVSYRTLHWSVAQAEANGEWDLARKSVNIFKGVKDDEWVVNCSRVHNINACDSESMTLGEIEGRRQVQELMYFFHKYVAGCEHAVLKSSASILGIRESRHIYGEHILKADELINGVVPEDSILVASNSVDVHGGGAGASSSVYTTIKAPWYGVPYRCLLPKKVENLLVAGRCLSAESDAAGAVRVMPPVMAMGHAAGVAAALSIKEKTTPKSLSFKQLRSELVVQKAFLG